MEEEVVEDHQEDTTETQEEVEDHTTPSTTSPSRVIKQRSLLQTMFSTLDQASKHLSLGKQKLS